ncbi:MAG: signal peptidase II [Pseudomonadales bacterium]
MWRYFAVSALIIVLDLWSKSVAVEVLSRGRITLFSWFDFALAYNTGAAFSFLSDAGGWQRWFFTAIAVLVSIFLVNWIRSLQKGQWILGLGLALVLGGAIGNVYDRLTLGYVVDFVSLHYDGYYWPAFNIADSAITVGAILLVWDMLVNGKEGNE